MMINGIELIEFYNMTENILNQLLKEILTDRYINNNRNYKSMIDFAWEEDNEYTKASRKLALQVAERTDYLIVIGYSFPYFNREIDTALIETMQKSNKLKSIYLQVGGNAESVKTRLKSIDRNLENKIKIVSDTEQFYLPDELEFDYLPSFVPPKIYSRKRDY